MKFQPLKTLGIQNLVYRSATQACRTSLLKGAEKEEEEKEEEFLIVEFFKIM